MSIIEIVLISIGLSMDAFTVALCQGLKMKKINYSHTIIIACCFGFFQALMPFLGWIVGKQFESLITSVDHWVAFVLLAFIGGKMILESFKKDEEEENKLLNIKEVCVMGIATSIDALAVGITFSVLPNIDILSSCLTIGAICFAFSFIAVIVGSKFGEKFKINTELIGGLILVGIGIKIFMEHLKL